MNIPLSLYIHFPWCIRKCPYCDFNSHAQNGELPEQAYIDALCRDLELDLAKIGNREIISIFMGGGTPSLFSPEAMHDLMQRLRKKLTFATDIEITMEANPGTVEQARFKGYRDAGINRLSLGIQSFDDQQLKILGRIHNASEAKRAIETVINTGFTNFNCDIMHGLANQSVAQALRDLDELLAFKPPHVSWYQLTLEPNTVFYKKPPSLPQDETIWTMQDEGKQRLMNAGHHHYEISAYAKPNHASKHNVNYWQFGDYLGIGAGAHSKLTNSDHTITRFQKRKQPTAYLLATDNYIAKQDIIPKEKRAFEFMLNALRLQMPFTIEMFTQRTGLSIDTILPILQQAHHEKLINFDDKEIELTQLGKRFSNDVMSMFL